MNKDYRGVTIENGGTIYFPRRQGSEMWMEHGKVIDSDSSINLYGQDIPAAKVVKDNGRTVYVTAFNRSIFLPSKAVKATPSKGDGWKDISDEKYRVYVNHKGEHTLCVKDPLRIKVYKNDHHQVVHRIEARDGSLFYVTDEMWSGIMIKSKSGRFSF